MVRLDASSTMTLTPGNETRTLHGYPCKKYTLRIPHIGIMTLWLSNAADLPPFHLLTAESPRRRGRGVWQEKWPTLIRHNQSFPMLALLETSEPPRERTPGERAEESPGEPVPRQEIMRWEVLSVGPKDPEDTDGERFSVPAGFHHTEPFQF